jgi:guanylate cyclase
MQPQDVVQLLNSVFSYLDTLVEKYGVEKIKTIGDCYMVAAGLPEPLPDHAERLIAMALEARDYFATATFSGGRRLSFRIGINSGPVVAGVIGLKRFIYDLWGDAVNTASRMESHGEPNVIQITEETFRLVSHAFECEERPPVEVKGKGMMPVWHVIRRKSKHSVLSPEVDN